MIFRLLVQAGPDGLPAGQVSPLAIAAMRELGIDTNVLISAALWPEGVIAMLMPADFLSTLAWPTSAMGR